MAKAIRRLNIPEFDIDVKRFYAPFVVEHDCQHCKRTLTHDFSDRYFSYPRLGAPYCARTWCEDCNKETEVSVILDLTLTFASES